MAWTRKRVWIVAVTVVLTALATLLLLNLMPAERRIQKPVERHYPVASPQFLRTMSVLLGPPIVGTKEAARGER